MKQLRFGIIAAIIIVCAVLVLPAQVQAAAPAEDLTQSTQFSGTGYESFSFLQNGETGDFRTSGEGAQITLENSAGMAQLYLLFDVEYGAYTITNNATGATVTAGENRFLHEYIDLQTQFGEKPVSVTLDFAAGPVQLSEISIYAEGGLPDDVQVWQKPLEGDIIRREYDLD